MSEPTPLPRRAFTVRQVAEALGVSRKHIERSCQRGEISCLRLGRSILIPSEALDELLDRATRA